MLTSNLQRGHVSEQGPEEGVRAGPWEMRHSLASTADIPCWAPLDHGPHLQWG